MNPIRNHEHKDKNKMGQIYNKINLIDASVRHTFVFYF